MASWRTEKDISLLGNSPMTISEKIMKWFNIPEPEITEEEKEGLFNSFALDPKNPRSAHNIVQLKRYWTRTSLDIQTLFSGYRVKEFYWYGADICYVTFKDNRNAMLALLDRSVPFVMEGQNPVEAPVRNTVAILVPAGHWRLGLPYKKGEEFFLRLANTIGTGNMFPHYRRVKRSYIKP